MPNLDGLRKAQRFFLIFVSTQASCFIITLFFAFSLAGFLLWLPLHPLGPTPASVLYPAQPRFLHLSLFPLYSCSALSSSQSSAFVLLKS